MPKTNGRKHSLTTSAAVTLPLAFGVSAFPAGDASASDPLPTRIKIANWGENLARGVREKFVVNEQTVQVLASEQARRGWDAVPGDYEHQSIPGHPNYKADPREYWAARGKVEAVPGEGLFYLPGSYTPSGKQHAASYQDVSGYFFLDPKTRAVIAVKSVALCEHGQVEGAEFMQAIAAAALASSDYGLSEAHEEILTFARDLLELGDDATTEDIAEGLEEMVRAKNQPPKPQASNPKPKPTMTEEEIKAALAAQKQQIDALTAGITQLTTNLTTLVTSQTRDQHNRDVEAVITAAVAAGKKVPDALKVKNADGAYQLAASQLKPVLDAIPATEPVSFLTPDGTVLPASGRFDFRPDASAEKEVMLALGITKESWDKGVPLIAGNAPQGDLARKLAVAS